MSAFGAVAAVVFAGGLTTAATCIVRSIAPQWRRIVRLATGHVEPAPSPEEHWRRVHLDADQRPLVSEIRAGALSRGLPGWMVRR